MNTLFKNRLLAISILACFTFISCKSTDNTIVIKDAPVAASEPDTENTPQNSDEFFQQLTIGEINSVRSLDPLFAENTSEMRTLQLIYEGLVRYDEKGEINPAIAKKWTESSDELNYRFTLQSDLFYHDSDIFSNGLGRKLTASDVKFVFERMARANVPETAAQLFMNIRGFEPYFQEQHQVMMASERQLKSISGIQTPNDSTVTFSLVEPDAHFLNKLASPYALIYPKEAVSNSGFKTVGTGPFYLSQKRSNSLYILAKFDNYRVPNQPKLDRVDIRTSSDEMTLLKSMSQGDVQLMPELGPAQMRMLLTNGGSLKNQFTQNYTLFNDKGASHLFLHYNTRADKPENEVINALNTVRDSTFFPELPSESHKVFWTLPESSDNSRADSLSVTYSQDPFVQHFYDALTEQLAKQGITLIVSKSSVANRNTPIRLNQYFSSFNAQVQTPPKGTLVALTYISPGIARKDVQGIKFNKLPWWIDLQTTTVSSANN